jgi:hypothetical protein
VNKTLQIGMRLNREERAWLDKVKREQRRLTDADAIDYLLWCYAHGYIGEDAILKVKEKSSK